MNKILKKFLTGTVAVIIIGAVAVSCSKSSGTTAVTPPTPLGGYVSSDDVAAANLVSYFPMDGTANDTKGGQTGTVAGGASFTTGLRGQSYQGAAHGYATITPSAAFSSLGSYSLSLWFKMPAQPVAGDPGGIFFLSGTTNGNELLFEVENYSPVSHDSIRVHHGFQDLASPAYQNFTLQAFDTSGINQWVHNVVTYDGATSTYTFYQNGQAVGVQSAFSSGGYISPTTLYTDGTMATRLGALAFTGDAPNKIVIGTWPAGLYGVSPSLGSNGCFLGNIDEIRVFNKAISAAEVNGLYLNGKAGR